MTVENTQINPESRTIWPRDTPGNGFVAMTKDDLIRAAIPYVRGRMQDGYSFEMMVEEFTRIARVALSEQAMLYPRKVPVVPPDADRDVVVGRIVHYRVVDTDDCLPGIIVRVFSQTGSTEEEARSQIAAMVFDLAGMQVRTGTLSAVPSPGQFHWPRWCHARKEPAR